MGFDLKYDFNNLLEIVFKIPYLNDVNDKNSKSLILRNTKNRAVICTIYFTSLSFLPNKIF